jgi:hypothetical protein
MATQVTPQRSIETMAPSAHSATTPTAERASRELAALRRRRRLNRAHVILSRVVLGGIAVQVFFAGLGIFTAVGFVPHATLGATLILSSFSLPALAHAGHLGRVVVQRSWLLAGLMVVQGLLIDIGRVVHVVAALHPVNAMALVLVTYLLATRRIDE